MQKSKVHKGGQAAAGWGAGRGQESWLVGGGTWGQQTQQEG